MKVTIDNNYGADADGNRGIKVYEYEIETSDTEDIVCQLIDAINDGSISTDANGNIDESETTYTITLIYPYTEEDIEFDVNIKDYL